ncbi:MAG: hypothetical protein JOZ15_04280 [Acidobacteria bacterium]|nr:hypothetical protein [Acidobacteriota bacterium]
MHARRALLFSLCAAVALAFASSALPAAAAPLEVIAVKVRVQSQNGASGGDFQIGDGVPAQVGERLKVSLVGTAMVNGAGQEVPIGARFSIAAGGHNCTLAGTGASWALVGINGAGGNGLCQLGYAASARYQMKPSLASGRITFKIAAAATAAVAPALPSPPPSPNTAGEPAAPQGYGRDRWHRAWELEGMLDRAILGEEPRGDRARLDVDRIYREGYGGVLTVAAELARLAEQRGQGRATLDRGYQERDVERLAGLYRDLLHRQQSDRELWQQDPGFRNNVEALHRKGLDAVVASIVDSDEFRTVNQIGPR